MIRFDPAASAPAAQTQAPACGKSDIRGLTLGMRKMDVLDLLAHKLDEMCADDDGGGLTFNCHAGASRESFGIVFTVTTPQFLRSIVYNFRSTHDRKTVIEDVSRSYGPTTERESIDWATWSVGGGTKLHLRGGANDEYTLILDNDAIAQQDYESVRRSRNETPSPRF